MDAKAKCDQQLQIIVQVSDETHQFFCFTDPTYYVPITITEVFSMVHCTENNKQLQIMIHGSLQLRFLNEWSYTN